MCRNKISKIMYEFLTDHMTVVEKEKSSVIEAYYKDKVEEGIDVGDFFKEYTAAINTYLNTTKIDGDGDDGCPLVIIGSTVEVEDIDEEEIYQYRILFPYSKNTDAGVDCASCLSPLGKALLLKTVNEQVSIQIPTGTLRYIIKKITMPDQMVSETNKTQKFNGNIRSTNMGLSI